MACCQIRGMKDEDVVKLNRLAKEKGISREEYLRLIVQKHLMESRMQEEISRYEELVQVMLDVVTNNSSRVEELTGLVEHLSSMQMEKGNRTKW